MESLKKYLSFHYYSLPLTDALQDQKVVVITPAGVIVGTPISNEEFKNGINTNIHPILASGFEEDYCEENQLSTSEPLDGNDGFFVLKNVTLDTGSSIRNFPTLNVFYDQIVAITVAEN